MGIPLCPLPLTLCLLKVKMVYVFLSQNQYPLLNGLCFPTTFSIFLKLQTFFTLSLATASGLAYLLGFIANCQKLHKVVSYRISLNPSFKCISRPFTSHEFDECVYASVDNSLTMVIVGHNPLSTLSSLIGFSNISIEDEPIHSSFSNASLQTSMAFA